MSRPMYNKNLRMNSQERSADSKSSTDFIVNYSNVQVLSKIVSVVVKHVSFPNVFYNVTTKNNVLRYERIVGEPRVIAVPVGNYTITSLLDALIESVEITQDPLTHLLTFTASVGSPLQIYGPEDGSTLALFLGISETTALNTSNFTTTNFPNLQGVQHVHIASKSLSKGNNFIDANKK